MNLKELRLSYGITQKEAASCVGIPIRTYIRYESIDDLSNLKYLKIMDILKDKYSITEDKGILTIDYITLAVKNVLKKYDDSISFCYLFGSYAKGYANFSKRMNNSTNVVEFTEFFKAYMK